MLRRTKYLLLLYTCVMNSMNEWVVHVVFVSVISAELYRYELDCCAYARTQCRYVVDN